MKRIKVKGHYRVVARDEKGRFVKVEKWSSLPKDGFEAKLLIAKSLKRKYPDAEVGFSHMGEHYIVTPHCLIRQRSATKKVRQEQQETR